MNAQTNEPLFRKQVAEHQSDRLHGDVHLAVPVRWHVIGFLLFAILCVALIFVATASYSRFETVAGTVVLDRGVAAVVPPRIGSVSRVLVRDGQQVAAGAPLVEVTAGESLTGGGTVSARVVGAVEQQGARLASQAGFVRTAGAAERARIREQIAGLQRELGTLAEQVRAQERLVQVAEQELADVRRIAGGGFVSRRDVNAREGVLLTRQQQLAQLRQAEVVRTSTLQEARQTLQRIAASSEAEAAGLESSRLALTQQAAEAEAGRGYTLVASVAGTVTAVTARVGQRATPERPVLMIVPRNAEPTVELQVPTRAAGFLQPGQEVRVAVDAFPYERFGTVQAEIVTISAVTVAPEGGGPEGEPVYLVTARLLRPYVFAFGRRQPLLPGMRLTARIITDRRSLLRMLFEPIYAVRQR